MHIILIAHNVRSTHNVGSFFRTADAFGVEKVYLTGYTPTPLDRFNRPRKDIAKTALGAEKTVQWGVGNINEITSQLRREGYTICALEQAAGSVNLKEFATQPKVVLILGNEVEGVDQGVLDVCDVILEIPMRGEKESLNVSVAAGIALFHLVR